MKRIKIFIASAGSLQEERNSIETFLSRKNDRLVDQNLYLETVIWEKMSSAFSSERKQNEFNDALLGCDMVICLLFDKVGPFTYEEFKKAYDNFLAKKKPKKIYVYFKDTPIKPSDITEDFKAVWKLKDEIKKHEQIYKPFDNTHDLLLKIEQNLNLDLTSIVNQSAQENLIELLNKINPEILNKFRNGQNQVSVMVSQGNLSKLNQIKEQIERENLMKYVTNGNTAMGIGALAGNGIRDKEEGFLLGFELIRLANFII